MFDRDALMDELQAMKTDVSRVLRPITSLESAFALGVVVGGSFRSRTPEILQKRARHLRSGDQAPSMA
jgi:hypothetical protein